MKTIADDNQAEDDGKEAYIEEDSLLEIEDMLSSGKVTEGAILNVPDNDADVEMVLVPEAANSERSLLFATCASYGNDTAAAILIKAQEMEALLSDPDPHHMALDSEDIITQLPTTQVLVPATPPTALHNDTSADSIDTNVSPPYTLSSSSGSLQSPHYQPFRGTTISPPPPAQRWRGDSLPPLSISQLDNGHDLNGPYALNFSPSVFLYPLLTPPSPLEESPSLQSLLNLSTLTSIELSPRPSIQSLLNLSTLTSIETSPFSSLADLSASQSLPNSPFLPMSSISNQKATLRLQAMEQADELAAVLKDLLDLGNTEILEEYHCPEIMKHLDNNQNPGPSLIPEPPSPRSSPLKRNRILAPYEHQTKQTRNKHPRPR